MPLCLSFAPSQRLNSATVKLRPLLLGLALVLIAGCGESDNRAAALATTETQIASDIKPHAKSVTLGSMGGSLRLDDRTGAVYSIELRDGAAFLQGLAVLRGTQRGWYNENIDAQPKTIRNPGIGASLGKHLVLIAPNADAIWIDDTKKVSLATANVVLFEGASGALTQVGSFSIDSYLGPAPLDNAKQRKALVQERLTKILQNSTQVSAAWSD